MRARGRPADGGFFAPGPPVHPSCQAPPRVITICLADIPLARATRLLAGPHTLNPSGTRAKILPRRPACPAAARASRLSRVPPRAGPTHHVLATPSGAQALSLRPAPFAEHAHAAEHAHRSPRPYQSASLAGAAMRRAPGLPAAAEGSAARGAGREGGTGPVPRAGIFKCPARSRAQEQPARQPARCRGQARIPPAPRARPPPPASCFPPAVGLLPARARLPAADTASGTGCLDSRDSRDSQASGPNQTGPGPGGGGASRVTRSHELSARGALAWVAVRDGSGEGVEGGH